MSYLIGTRSFTSKSKIADYVKSILKRYSSGRSLSKDDESFISLLLENHPNKGEKIGCGIERIEVRLNPPKYKGFWIVRKDGTQVDFSYIACLKGSSKKGECRSVARNEVKSFVIEFKQRFFEDDEVKLCPITGEEISFSNSHVHHSGKSFDELFTEFFGKLDIGTIKIVDSGAINKLFANRKLAKAWCEFHNSHAELQIVSIIANLSILEKGRKKGEKHSVGGIKKTENTITYGETTFLEAANERTQLPR